MSSSGRKECPGLAAREQNPQLLSHPVSRQVHAVAVTGQDPLEWKLKQLFRRTAQGGLLPDIDSRQPQTVDLPVPRHVVAREELAIPIQQRHAAVCISGYRNDLE